jgi:hypothetical protein
MLNADGSSVEAEIPFEHFFGMLNDTAIRFDSTNKIVAKTQRQNHQTDRRPNGNRDRTGGRGRGEFQYGRNSGGRGRFSRGNGTKHKDFMPHAEYEAMSQAKRSGFHDKRDAAATEAASQSGRAPFSSIAIYQQASQSVVTIPPSVALVPAADSFIRNMLSNSSATRSAAGTVSTDLLINGKIYRYDMHRIQYNYRPDLLLELLVRFVWTIF